VGGGVVIAVVVHREAGAFEQRAVVFPARVADRHGGVGQQALEEVGAGLQRAGATQRLGGHHAAVGQQGGVGAEQQLLHRAVIAGQALDGQVAARGAGGQAGFLGFGNGLEQRNSAILVVVNPDTQIDLSGADVGIESSVEYQKRGGRSLL